LELGACDAKKKDGELEKNDKLNKKLKNKDKKQPRRGQVDNTLI
jgi:hypothetical protein